MLVSNLKNSIININKSICILFPDVHFPGNPVNNPFLYSARDKLVDFLSQAAQVFLLMFHDSFLS